ncbi:hypothetical protein ACFX14_025043 [Malus domestica]
MGTNIVCPWGFLAETVMPTTNMPPVQPILKARTFAFVVSIPIEDVHLSQLPTPVVRGDKTYVKISEDLYQEQLKLFQNNLLGRLLLKKGSTPMKTGALKSCLEDAWRPTAPWNLVPIGYQNGRQILNQEYWHPRHLMEIARGVGTPLQLDSATRERQYDDLPTSLMVERESHGFPMSRGRSRSRTRKGGNMGDNKTGDHSRSQLHMEYRPIKDTTIPVNVFCGSHASEPEPLQQVDQLLPPGIKAADDGNAEPILQSPLGITPAVSGNVIPETDTADTHISIQSPGISHISNSMTGSLSPDGSHPLNGLSYGQHLGNTIVPNNLGPHDLCDDSSTPPGFEQVETVAHNSQQLGNTDVPNNFGMQDPHDNHSIPPGFEHVATLAKDVIDIVNHIEGCDMDGFTPVLFWNIRGIGNDDSRTELSNICRLHHPDLVCIAEPMVTVRCTFDHIPSQFTFVYASTSPIKRRDLWADFISLRPQTQVPWMAIGDFNAILGAHEQMGGGRPSQASCAQFSNMSDTCNFTHLNTSGAAFTWSNGWRSRGRTERRVANARHNLSMIQQRISTEGINNDLFEEEIVAKTTVMESLQMQEAFWKDRARVKWLTKGDRNSSFFHAYARIKSSSSHISCILDGNNLLTDPLAIENHIVNFYQTLFGSSFTPSGIDEVCEVIQPMVTDSENDLLSALPTDEEIKEAAFSLSASSAPGPDGFPGFFYHHCWDIVSFDVIQFVKQFFQSNWLYPNANSNFLVLIPKVEDAISMTHFRPIALANFLFKIIPKILAIRLSHVVQRIISPHQAAFIPGRRITDCIGLVSECFNVLDKKTRGGNMGVKVDIAKAFDTLDWSFLLREALSRGLSCLQLDGLTKPTFAPRGCISPSHVLYADDLFIFCRSDGVTLRNLQGFFDRYSRASGQFINKAKSTFYLGSTSRHRKAVVESYLGFKEGKAPFVYLGVPIFCGKPKRSYLQALADKAKAKLTGWKGKLLSMAGRVQLTQSVFQSMLLHSFSVYKWPSSLLRPFSRCARNFIWSGDVTSKKSVTVSWRQICAPKNESGLGLRDLGSLNTTALLKLGWLIITTDSPWSIYLRERFKLHGRLYSCSYKRSSIWPGIKSILHILFQNCRWVIGNGSTTSLWVDKWLDNPIVDVVGATEIAPSLSRTKVSNIIRMGKWVIPSIFSSTFPDLTKEILEMPLPIDEDKDVLIWEVSTSGVFSFSDGYEIVRHRFPVKSWASIIWRPFIPPRYSILVWKILFNKLPTEDQLQRRGIPLAPICQLCHKNSESIDHLFSSCEFAQCAWRWLATQFGTIIPPTGSISDLWLVFLSKRFSPHLRNVWIASGFFLLMAIWKMRNKVKFEGKPPSLSRLCRSTSAWIRQVGVLTPGHVRGILDRQLLVSLGISPNSYKAPSIVPVLWLPPPFSWVKVNTDGLAKGNPGPAACGGVFRDSAGYFLGGFSLSLGHRTSFYAELHAVILAIELAHARGWQNLWLESDSSSVISCFASGSFSPPWSLQTCWNNCTLHLQNMVFRCSYIFRVGNVVADKLANLGLLSSSLVWHSTPPIEILPPMHSDFLGMPTYRFVSSS